MGFINAFWKAAAEIDPDALELDESARFPFCDKEGLAKLCRDAGTSDPEIAAIEVDTRFPDFEAFWHPFTLGGGPAPGYVTGLPDAQQQKLRDHLANKFGASRPVILPARAWAVRARWPAE